MMRIRSLPMVAAVLAAVVCLSHASAQDSPDIVVSSVEQALLGERFTIVVEARTAADVQVEVDPSAASWAGVEVLGVSAEEPRSSDDGLVHQLTITAASFQLGAVEVRPSLLFIADGLVTAHEAPPFSIVIASSLAPGAPLELTGPPQPQAIAAGTRSWETPLAIGAAVVMSFVLLSVLIALVRHRPRRMRRLQPVPAPASASPGVPLPADDDAMTDPVAAYRTMGSSVRRVLAARYSLPAQALTTGELGRRMEAEGVDRWQARLVRGLLENCDAVVYAGYLPAPDRRRADINIAREIVEGSA